MFMKHTTSIVACVALASCFYAAPCAAQSGPSATTKEKVQPPIPAKVKLTNGLEWEDKVVGSGAEPRTGQTLVVDYVGWLEDGTKFDASTDRNTVFRFPIGTGRVIKGWDLGLASMRVGGTRILRVPPSLGYGDRRAGPIPPGSTLIFEVHLHAIE